MEVLQRYAQRFAKSSDELVKIEDFDSSAFKWNVRGILDDEPPSPEPVRRAPDYFFHQRIPASLPSASVSLSRPTEIDETNVASQDPKMEVFRPSPISDGMDIRSFLVDRKTETDAAAHLGQAHARMSGQLQIAKPYGAPKNLALRVPLPGAPPNKSIVPKLCQGGSAKGKGASKGLGPTLSPEVVPLSRAERTSIWDKVCTKDAPTSRSSGKCRLPKSLFTAEGFPECCCRCRLPLGDHFYRLEDGRGLHGECMAQRMLQNLQEDADKRNQKDDEEKNVRRREYDIGWKPLQIPRNIELQAKLKGPVASHGMCCLVLNEDSRSMSLSATIEPSAAINLEYLSLALQVRRTEGREPLFSLDPSKVQRPTGDHLFKLDSQVKRFEPEWLAGTSAGNVLFQADYHLKELSMGEHEQPVLGMKSCLDFSEAEGLTKTWSAREWFMVRKAEVHLSEDGVLIPLAKMGVEAREQVNSRGHLVDAPITRRDHPMVKYAEFFTKNFDLIAERKSVIYHLRELAKASVLAKFIIDAKLQTEESWFSLADEREEACALEIPQLWNERVHSRIHVRDGEILDKRLGSQLHGIYGGVQFGLDRFTISQAQPRKTMPSAPMGPLGGLAGGILARIGVPGSIAAAPISGAFPTMSALPNMSVPFKPPSFTIPSQQTSLKGLVNLAAPKPPRIATPLPGISSLTAPLRGAATPLAGLSTVGAPPRGVDLNLNQFSLDVVEQTTEGNWRCEPQTEEAVAAVAEGFWSCIDGTIDSSIFQRDDTELLKHIFNPNLSDRRSEGICFSPPDTSIAYVTKLRSLISAEEEIRQQRKEHFFSASFSFDDAGPLFPYCWGTALGIAGSKTSDHVLSQACVLQARTDYREQAEEVLKAASAAFHKKTEDGMSFRIYRVGTVEVRTTQEYDGEEVIGAVFSVRRSTGSAGIVGAARCVAGREKVLKVTQRVHRVQRGAFAAALAPDHFDVFRYYVVLETEHGSTVLTEQLEDGAVTWHENPADLEDRNSLAKVIRTASCRSEVTIQDMRLHRVQVLQESHLDIKRGESYATSSFIAAVGGVEEAIKAIESRERDMKLREAEVIEND